MDPARLLAITFDAIFVFDWTSGTITFWNPGAEALYGWKGEEAIGRRPDELLQTEHPRSRDEILETLERSGRWEGLLVQRARDGRVIVVDARWVLDRETSAVLEVNRDITIAWHSAEMLQGAERARIEFIEQVAHHLRTPVTLLRGYLELLEQRRISGPADQDYVTALERLHESADDMHAVTERLIAAARSAAANRSTLLPVCNLAAVARRTIAEVSRDERTVERIDYQGPEDLPVVADPVHLELLVRELLIAACRRAEGGKVAAALARRGADASLTVSVKQDSASPEGHGPSLEVPQRVARLHGGDVAATVERGGLRFELTLPVAS